ncbi:MAG: murein transglycosylase [Bdellovibrionaceae bacterium]|nr:murein transglycosylase [Pseudobdellovibrionaceae bacterium]
MTRRNFWIAVLLTISLGCAESGEDSLPLITPTVYYKPVINLDKMTCNDEDLIDIKDENDMILSKLCKREYDNCLLQGSCYVVEGGKTRAFNFTKKIEGTSRFSEKREIRCPYGYGVRSICLDPFYSVAADPTFHVPGSVIFVPKLVGLKLPSGSLHNGYFVVRDEGGAIIGENRFDFFTGFYGPYEKDNSFSRIGLSDKRNKFGYQKMSEALAKKVREYRNYPNTPNVFDVVNNNETIFENSNYCTLSLALTSILGCRRE